MRRSFIVSLDMPHGTTVEQVVAYIEDAVATMKGCYHPNNEMFDLDDSSVKVRPVTKPKS